MIFYMELHVIPWNLCLFPRAGRACAAKTCASRLVAACMQGQPGVAEDSEYTALGRWGLSSPNMTAAGSLERPSGGSGGLARSDQGWVEASSLPASV